MAQYRQVCFLYTNEKFAPMNNKKCDDELCVLNVDVVEVVGNNNLYGQLQTLN